MLAHRFLPAALRSSKNDLKLIFHRFEHLFNDYKRISRGQYYGTGYITDIYYTGGVIIVSKIIAVTRLFPQATSLSIILGFGPKFDQKSVRVPQVSRTLATIGEIV